jgi:hypothetical protein
MLGMRMVGVGTSDVVDGAGLLTDALLPQTMRTEIGSDENGAPADGR